MNQEILKTNNFITKVKNIHGNKYDYSKTIYKTNKKKVIIICKIHGEFEQIASHHLKGCGCRKCGEITRVNKRKTNPLDFILVANKTHNNKYDYSLMKYENTHIKIKIICPEHGIFEQSPKTHLNGHGCPDCGGSKLLTQNIFINRSKKIHKEKYDYSLVEYKNSEKKVIIICPIHGEFKQKPINHLKGNDCLKCGYMKNLIGFDEFTKRSHIIHNNKFDYSLVCYERINKKVIILCPKHGSFLQTPDSHLKGCGCPKCKESTGERKIRIFLEKENIKYISQKRFSDCRDVIPLSFDFFLVDYNICIEYNGIQHYEPCDYFGGEITFNKQIKKDKIKKEYCNNNNIKLVIIRYDEDINDVLNKLLVI